MVKGAFKTKLGGSVKSAHTKKHSPSSPPIKKKAKTPPRSSAKSSAPSRQLTRRTTEIDAIRAVDAKLWWVPAEIRHTAVNEDGATVLTVVGKEQKKNKRTSEHLKDEFWKKVISQHNLIGNYADRLQMPEDPKDIRNSLLDAAALARKKNGIGRTPQEILDFMQWNTDITMA